MSTAKISEQEFNRSPAMQKKWGSYSNYFKGRKTTSGGFYSQTSFNAENRAMSDEAKKKELEARKKADEVKFAVQERDKLANDFRERQRKVWELQQYASTSSVAASFIKSVQDEQVGFVEKYEQAQKRVESALDAYMPVYDDFMTAADKIQSNTQNWYGTVRDKDSVQKEIASYDALIAKKESAYNTAKVQTAELKQRGISESGMLPNVQRQWAEQSNIQLRQLEREIKELKEGRALLEEELALSQEKEYAALKDREDFEETSKYVSTANGKETSVSTDLFTIYGNKGFDDPMYDYINKNEDAIERFSANDAAMLKDALGIDMSHLLEMSDEEVAIYNYLWNKDEQAGDKTHKSANDYIKFLTPQLTARQRAKTQEEWAERAREDPVGTSILSIIESPLKTISYIGQAVDYLSDGKIDQNAGYNKFSYINSAIRDEVSSIAEQKWGGFGSFAYQTGMSMGDFLFNSFITGGFGSAGRLGEGALETARRLSLGIMGAGAAADTVIEAKDRGLSDWQAFSLGTIAGAAEIFTEKFSIEALLEGKWEDGAIKYIVKNAFTEGTEEVASDFINLFADILISKDKSQWAMTIDAYKKSGKSEQDAFINAMRDQALSMGLDFLGGAFSGGIMASFGAAIQHGNYNKIGGDIRALGDDGIDAVFEAANKLSKDSEVYKQAQELKAKRNAGQPLSDAEIGRLFAGIHQEVSKQKNAASAKEATEIQKIVNKYVDNSIAKSRFVENPVINNEIVPDLQLGIISDTSAQKLYEEYGIDLSGYNHVLSDNDVRHIFNRHGPHTNEAMPITADDIKSIPTIINNADEIYYLPRKDGKRGIMYQYRHNGTTYYLEQIIDEGKKLRNKQMIKTPTGTVPDIAELKAAIAKKGISSLPGDAEKSVPRMYVQDVRNDANISIAQNIENGSKNQKISQSRASLPENQTSSVTSKTTLEMLKSSDNGIVPQNGENINAGNGTQAPNANYLGNTPNASLASSLPTNNIISQNGEDINGNNGANSLPGDAEKSVPRMYAQNVRNDTDNSVPQPQMSVNGITAPTAEQGATVLPRAQEQATGETQTSYADESADGLRAEPKTAAQTQTELTGRQNGVSENTIERATRIARAIGKEIIFYSSTEQGENGHYDNANGVIYINAMSENPIAQIIAHEMTHAIENNAGYDDLQRLIFDRIARSGADIEEVRRHKRAVYERAGHGLSGDNNIEVDREITAEYIERNLLTDEDAIYTTVNQNRSLGQRILQFINDLLGKLGIKSAQDRAFLMRARGYYQNALQQTREGTANDAGAGTDTNTYAETNVHTKQNMREESTQSTQGTQERTARETERYAEHAQIQRETTDAIRELREAYRNGEITETEFDEAFDILYNAEEDLQNGIQYSISEIAGEKEDYGKGVILDTEIFKGVNPRNWGRALGDFVYNNLAGEELTIYDENGNAETVQFARENDRVRKDGAKNSRKVIDKLARYKGDNIRAVATIHLSELLETSRYENTTDEHSHQWMDENGWTHRKTYLQDRDGNIYEATLNIAEGRDRRILYDISNIRKIDTKNEAIDGAVPSTENGRGSLINNSFDNSIPSEYGYVNEGNTANINKRVQAQTAATSKRGISDRTSASKPNSMIYDEAVNVNNENISDARRLTLPTAGDDGIQYSINETFERDIDDWERDGRPNGETFILGSTGDVLQGLGAMEQDIYLQSDKINTILRDHPEMTPSEIKHIPEILDDPVLILKSRNVGRGGRQNTRMVIFGSIKAQNGQPIMSVLDLRPVENGFLLDDMQKVNSAYTRDNPIDFLKNSEVMYADEKRTIPLLRNLAKKENRNVASLNRLAHTGPIELQRYGSLGSISYRDDAVNLEGVPFSSVIDTNKEGNAATSTNPSPGAARNTALTSDNSIPNRNGNVNNENISDARRLTLPTAGDDGIQYSITGKTADGTEVYETSDEVRAMPYKKRMKTFMDIMRNEYRGRTAKFTADGNIYYAKFDDVGIQKNIYGDRKSSPKGWKAKINVGADGDIFELIENTKHHHGSQEQGKTTAAHRNVNGWEYFIKTVQIDGTVYDLLANVRKKPDGEFVYYIQLNENTEKSSSPVAVFANRNPALEVGELDDNSISNRSDDVNRENISNSKENRNTASLNRLAHTGPTEVQRYGSSENISYRNDAVNLEGVPFSSVVNADNISDARRPALPTAGDDGIQYSISRTRNMNWEDQVNGYFSNNGTIGRYDALYLGESNVQNIQSSPLYIPTSVINKAIRTPKGSRSAHSLQTADIMRLKSGIDNAPIVIHNPTRNALIYVTENRDGAGNHIIATFDLNHDLYGENAHKATSIHGRENITALLEGLDANATVFAENENKLNQMLSTGQILKSLTLTAKVELVNESISNHTANVNEGNISDAREPTMPTAADTENANSQYSIGERYGEDRREIISNIRGILNRGGSAAELRRYVNMLSQSGRANIQTDMSAAQEIVRNAHEAGLSVNEYLSQNWDMYEYDGEPNDDAKRALELERRQSRQRYSISENLEDDLHSVLSGTYPSFENEVYIGETSNFLTDIIGADRLTVTMPANKAYSAMVTEAEAKRDGRYRANTNYHGLGAEGLRNALEASETPIAAFADTQGENGKRADNIVLVTDQMKDSDNGRQYIVVVQSLNARGMMGGTRIDANKVITTYDRSAVAADIERAAADGRLLHLDKKRSQAILAGVPAANSRTAIREADFNKNIQDFWSGVKWAQNGKTEYTQETENKKTALQYAWEEAQRKKNGVTKDQYSISETYEREIDDWIAGGKRDRQSIYVGRTSQALKSIGIQDKNIFWDTTKINNIQNKHMGITDNVIKQVPNIIENPVLVMESKTRANRLTMYGEVYNEINGVPVMAVIELKPISARGYELNEIKVVNAYSRDGNNPNATMRDTQSIIDTSNILYIDPNKERTDTWLSENRLQLPLQITEYGPIGRISYIERDGNGNFTAKSDNEKTPTWKRQLENYDQYSINETFKQDIDDWERDGRPNGETFILGSTGDVLQGLGAMEQDIYLQSDKINTILRDHPEMTPSEIKHIPEILDDPVLILKSNGTGKHRANSRMVLFGSVNADNGQPVMSVLDLRPFENGFLLNDMQKVNSAYTKNNPINFLKKSEVMYADGKRTIPLLRKFGLTTASRQLLRNGSMGSIFYKGTEVNIEGVPFSSVTDIDSDSVDLSENTRYNGENIEADERRYSDDTGRNSENVQNAYRAGSGQADGNIDYTNGSETYGDGEDVSVAGGERDGDGRRNLRQSAGAVQGEQAGREYSISESDDEIAALPKKAQSYLKRAENDLVRRIGDAMSVPRHAQREFLQELARDISKEYLREGTVSQKTIDNLFERAYNEGIETDSDFYDNYKGIKDYMRRRAVTVSENIRGDIADWNDFRKSAAGTLRLVNEGGAGADTVYEELRAMAPELFPSDIVNPTDMLMHMFEVGRSIQSTEKTLNEYYGDEAQEFKRWAKNDFNAAINDAMSELRNVKRYAQEREAKAAERAQQANGDIREMYAGLKNARRTYEKAAAKNLLTDHDRVQVGRLLRGEIEIQHLDEATDNIKGIKAIYEARQEYEKLSRQIKRHNEQRKTELRAEADEYLKTVGEWKDKTSGLKYARETMERNIRDIVKDRKTAERIIEKYFKPVHDSEADANRAKNKYRGRIRALEISQDIKNGNKVSEAYAVQFLGEAEDNIRVMEQSHGAVTERDGKTLTQWRDEVLNLWLENPNLDEGKIRRAINEFRNIYDELFEQMNEVRVRNGYEPINYRRGYFPHFQSGTGDGVTAQFGRAMGIDTSTATVPTAINDLTANFKTGIQWFGNAKSRQGTDTQYNALEGFDRYIEGAAGVIYQTDNIQRLRALASQIRYRTSGEGIRKQADTILENAAINEADKQLRLEKLYETGRPTLNNFVEEMDEYTNLLANKRSRYDRFVEHMLGSRIYNAAKWFESRVAVNMVAVNPASWLTNFIPLTQGAATLDRGMLLKGMWDTLKAYKTDDGIADMSTFLTNRRGSDPIVKSWKQSTAGKLSSPMEYIDLFTADSLVRARYAQNLKKGLSEDAAMNEADAWTASIMADRSKGSMPTLFERKNPIAKAMTQFQLEVNNQLSYLFKDMPKDARDKGLKALTAALLKFFFGAYLFNEVYEFFIGRRPALDPIGILNETAGDITGYELPNLTELGTGMITGDMPSFKTERKDAKEAIGRLGKNISEEIPFVGNYMGGGRLPVENAIPDIGKVINAATNSEQSGRKRLKTAGKELGKLAAYFFAPFGGGQMKKIYEGIDVILNGGSYVVDSEGNDILQYPLYNDTPLQTGFNAARMMLFGKTSLPTAQDWIDRDFKNFGAKETASYQAMTAAGVSRREAYELVSELKAAEKTQDESRTAVQADILRASSVSAAGKAAAYYGMIATDKERALLDELDDAGADPNNAINTLMDIKDAESRSDKMSAIARADIGDNEVRLFAGYVMGTELVSESGSATQYGKLMQAMDKGIDGRRGAQLLALGADLEKYLKITDAGANADTAYKTVKAISELEPAGGSDKISDAQRWRAVIDATDDTGEQIRALRAIMSESTHRKLEIAYDFGVEPSMYVALREIMPRYDANGNGSYSNAEITAAINAMSGYSRLPGGGSGNLTTGQKAVLWQVMTSSKSAKNNPYSSAVGRRVLNAKNGKTQSYTSGIKLPTA